MNFTLKGHLVALNPYQFTNDDGENIEGTRLEAIIYDDEGNQGKVLENVIERVVLDEQIASLFKTKLPLVNLKVTLSSRKVLKVIDFEEVKGANKGKGGDD